ncbi:hypothetical protein SARC_09221 [Sphaeroforma arctica JP610]|uniref:Deltex C-terminal domain-containing protein n=1 Tax=Sphaeroforma arctica JP610 TaxID=667725 RepID=A0A0L0FQR1_9EUKA|nr:hypothetical protein SARC_09221 [Sphaeroforma arctica JP610]KNC78348.1 hypothetical protein SARC_09221 [Sphaeroforma arctica JP610]|eukprot:XP_014152250.1 hypothetical protein SARC_09221 [Sphaeroforma arctica JP610]
MSGQYRYDGQSGGNRKANVSYSSSPNTRATVFPYPSPDRVHKVEGDTNCSMMQAMTDFQTIMVDGRCIGLEPSTPQSPAMDDSFRKDTQQLQVLQQPSQASGVGGYVARSRSGVLLNTASYQGQQLGTQVPSTLNSDPQFSRESRIKAPTSVRLERCLSDSSEILSSSIQSDFASSNAAHPRLLHYAATSGEYGSREAGCNIQNRTHDSNLYNFKMDYNGFVVPSPSEAQFSEQTSLPRQQAVHQQPRRQSPTDDRMAMLDRILSMDHMDAHKQLGREAVGDNKRMQQSLKSTLSGPMSYFNLNTSQHDNNGSDLQAPLSRRQTSVPVSNFGNHKIDGTFAQRQIPAPIPHLPFEFSASPSMPVITDVSVSPCSPMASVLSEPNGFPPMMRSMTDMLRSTNSAPVLKVTDGYSTNIWYNQKDGGSLKTTYATKSLPGYARVGTIILTFDMECGVIKKAYLPDNEKGKAVRVMMGRAFGSGILLETRAPGTPAHIDLRFRVELKTRRTGGKTICAYPDPKYLDKVFTQLMKLLDE